MIDAYVAPVEQLKAVATEFLDMRRVGGHPAAASLMTAIPWSRRSHVFAGHCLSSTNRIAPLSISAPRG